MVVSEVIANSKSVREALFFIYCLDGLVDKPQSDCADLWSRLSTEIKFGKIPM